MRSRVIRELLANIKSQGYIPESSEINLNGKKVLLPAYIPYIGSQYFDSKPRILCYAINQNLSRHSSWTPRWISFWTSDSNACLDRLNTSLENLGVIPMKPYAEGFIPLIALILLKLWPKKQSNELPNYIDDAVAATNFIKFSTDNDASSTSIPPLWWQECGERYVGLEIKLLRPDVIIAFGQKTYTEVNKTLANIAIDYDPTLLLCRFPARIASIKSRKLTSLENRTWERRILPLVSRIREPVKGSCFKWKIFNYPGYFVDTMNSWQSLFESQKRINFQV